MNNPYLVASTGDTYGEDLKHCRVVIDRGGAAVPEAGANADEGASSRSPGKLKLAFSYNFDEERNVIKEAEEAAEEGMEKDKARAAREERLRKEQERIEREKQKERERAEREEKARAEALAKEEEARRQREKKEEEDRKRREAAEARRREEAEKLRKAQEAAKREQELTQQRNMVRILRGTAKAGACTSFQQCRRDHPSLPSHQPTKFQWTFPLVTLTPLFSLSFADCSIQGLHRCRRRRRAVLPRQLQLVP